MSDKQPKYDYSQLMSVVKMLKVAKNAVNIADLRTFYPKAGWTELRQALIDTDNLIYNPQTHEIKVAE